MLKHHLNYISKFFQKIGLISINFCHCAVAETASNSVVASKKRQTKSGGLGGRRQSPKSFTSARRKKTAEAEASSDSDQGYLNSFRFGKRVRFDFILILK